MKSSRKLQISCTHVELCEKFQRMPIKKPHVKNTQSKVKNSLVQSSWLPGLQGLIKPNLTLASLLLDLGSQSSCLLPCHLSGDLSSMPCLSHPSSGNPVSAPSVPSPLPPHGRMSHRLHPSSSQRNTYVIKRTPHFQTTASVHSFLLSSHTPSYSITALLSYN